MWSVLEAGVILEAEGAGRAEIGLLAAAALLGHNGVELDEDSIVNDGGHRRLLYLALGIAGRGGEEDVVALPLLCGAGGVDQGGRKAVEGTGNAVGIGGVVERIEHLQFVAAEQIDARVAPQLALLIGHIGELVFEMDLRIAVERLGGGVFRPGDTKHGLIFVDGATGGLSIGLCPLAEARAIKENDGVGGRERRFCTRLHYGGLGTQQRGEGEGEGKLTHALILSIALAEIQELISMEGDAIFVARVELWGGEEAIEIVHGPVEPATVEAAS